MTPTRRIDVAAQGRRGWIRLAAAAVCAATALLYFLIGTGVLTVVEEVAADAPSMAVFGATAGGAFVLGAVLLLLFDRRILWVLGALFQVGVIVMYVNVSTQRTPPFEVWGLTIKALQVVVLVALVYLLIRTPERDRIVA